MHFENIYGAVVSFKMCTYNFLRKFFLYIKLLCITQFADIHIMSVSLLCLSDCFSKLGIYRRRLFKKLSFQSFIFRNL